MVCGSRYIRGGSRIGGPLWKAVFSRWGGIMVNLLTGLPTKDATNAFKMYTREGLNRIKIQSKGFEISLEIPLKLYFSGYKVCEIPTRWISRKKGRSKFSFRFIISYWGWILWGLLKRVAKVMEEKRIK